ncbi:MAG: hypothetical protein HEQ23_07060 [Tepidisphaera sp.]
MSDQRDWLQSLPPEQKEAVLARARAAKTQRREEVVNEQVQLGTPANDRYLKESAEISANRAYNDSIDRDRSEHHNRGAQHQNLSNDRSAAPEPKPEAKTNRNERSIADEPARGKTAGPSQGDSAVKKESLATQQLQSYLDKHGAKSSDQPAHGASPPEQSQREKSSQKVVPIDSAKTRSRR